jgi:hypothetical protein
VEENCGEGGHVVRGNGGAELVRNEEGLPLPKQFRLGLEKGGWN